MRVNPVQSRPVSPGGFVYQGDARLGDGRSPPTKQRNARRRSLSRIILAARGWLIAARGEQPVPVLAEAALPYAVRVEGELYVVVATLSVDAASPAAVPLASDENRLPLHPIRVAIGESEVLTAEVAGVRAAGVDWQLYAYGSAVHSFTNPASGNDPSKGAAYNENADQRSWQATRAFFDEIFGAAR